MATRADPHSRQGQTMIEPAACFAYIETTIAPGITLSDYRCSRPARRRWRRRAGSSAADAMDFGRV